jgi:hypothetical protein
MNVFRNKYQRVLFVVVSDDPKWCERELRGDNVVVMKTNSPAYSADLAPWEYHLFPEPKKQFKSRYISSDTRSLLQRRPGWTDKVLNFFEWLARVRATG